MPSVVAVADEPVPVIASSLPSNLEAVSVAVPELLPNTNCVGMPRESVAL